MAPSSAAAPAALTLTKSAATTKDLMILRLSMGALRTVKGTEGAHCDHAPSGAVHRRMKLQSTETLT
ncbi:hypothetical protein GCM10020216_104840 [Nonomuraea helvata]